MDEPFTLQNAPQVRKQDFTPRDNRKQRVLFAGMNCLPGQLDLFQTDGELPEGSDDGVRQDSDH